MSDIKANATRVFAFAGINDL